DGGLAAAHRSRARRSRPLDGAARVRQDRPRDAGERGPAARAGCRARAHLHRMSEAGRRLVELSHVIRDGLVTYPGLPAPVIEDHLSREASRAVYAPGTEFHIARIDMVANT